MKRSTLVIIVLLIVVLGVGGLYALSNRSDKDKGASPDNTASTQQQQTSQATNQQNTENNQSQESDSDQIEIADMAFSPASITVKKGTTVTWTNRDAVQHDVTPDEESAAFQGSELLSEGESYSFTFDTPGTYTYHCGPHPQMTGTVTVTE